MPRARVELAVCFHDAMRDEAAAATKARHALMAPLAFESCVQLLSIAAAALEEEEEEEERGGKIGEMLSVSVLSASRAMAATRALSDGAERYWCVTSACTCAVLCCTSRLTPVFALLLRSTSRRRLIGGSAAMM